MIQGIRGTFVPPTTSQTSIMPSFNVQNNNQNVAGPSIAQNHDLASCLGQAITPEEEVQTFTSLH